MLYLNINETNILTTTLYENSVISGTAAPLYIWQLINADDNNEFIFSNDDISPNYWYYNQFQFTSIPGATYGATQGIVGGYPGSYTYIVYQATQSYTLDITGLNQVETGIFNIVGTNSNTPTFTATQIIKTFRP